MSRLFLLLGMLLVATHSMALPSLSPQEEARAKTLFGTLHCVVCGGQSLAGSDAQIARDIRTLIREKIAAGESDDAIVSYLVQRYGEGILMEPPLRSSTLPLWLAPVGFLAIAGVIAWRLLFHRRKGISA